MVSKIGFIGIDLDGTLLRNDQSVSEHNKAAIIHSLNKGVLVYLVTGRPYCFAKHLAKQIDERIKVISSNGGIYDIGNRCIQHNIDESALREVVKVLQETEMHAYFKGFHEFYTHEPYDERFLYDHHNAEYEEELRVHSFTDLSWDELREKAEHIVKILVYHFDDKHLLQARNKIECIKGVEVTDYQRISFDITASKVNKGNILKKVLQEYGIKKEEFMAIGDAHNDIPMFQEAGICVGMENAEEDVKKYCDYISDDYMHDGVAKAIEHFLE